MQTQIRPRPTSPRPSLPSLPPSSSASSAPPRATALSFPSYSPPFPKSIAVSALKMALKAAPANTQIGKMGPDEESLDLDVFAAAARRMADAAGEVIRLYFRKKFEILDKDDLSEFDSWRCLFMLGGLCLLW
ncbi:hypothetical protein MLD38_013536 [Melastoma candidum]|uniref:Uncharacterized protein n=1 Tax=Melastoma candidum TaxID=119954 RepID=A0ACB9RB14_9MYRT|nr:hypothetical protein MLD38_013536 [Melastoma candidum]